MFEKKRDFKLRDALSWQEVEKAILKEMKWLESTVPTSFGSGDKDTAGRPVCRHCVLRSIAQMLIYGDVEAKQITKGSDQSEFWLDNQVSNWRKTRPNHHGQEWHSETMRKIEGHFQALYGDGVVEREPNLSLGRADLGVFVSGERPLYIEVGTTSFYKLGVNLKAMASFVYLIVSNDDTLIEFCKSTNTD